MSQLEFRAGELLFQEGETSRQAFLLESGVVEILGGTDGRPVGTIHAGEVVGEMALIDDRPRRHAARAATPVRATRLTREEFSQLLQGDPRRCAPYLTRLFERLRELDAQLAPSAGSVAPREGKTSGRFRLNLYPLSRYATSVLDPDGITISTFPFRLGRASEAREPSAVDLNDLWLLDKAPFNVSRNHVAFDLVSGRYVVRDRGSQLGTIVNEKLLGGKSSIKQLTLEEGDNVIVLGARTSPFQFRAVLERVTAEAETSTTDSVPFDLQEA